MSKFQRATRHQAKLRLAIAGGPGSGKTYTAFRLAEHLTKAAGAEAFAVIDTERGSASKYAFDPERPDAGGFVFDVVELESFEPEHYIEAIVDAYKGGRYPVLVIDSLSHAWAGVGGILEQVDRAKMTSNGKENFTAWQKLTPKQNKLIDAILRVPLHLIVTMRAKTEYVIEMDARGRQVPRKVGLAPIQRDGVEYEFDVFGMMDADNTLVISKTRCSALNEGIFPKPGPEVAGVLLEWLSAGAPADEGPEGPEDMGEAGWEPDRPLSAGDPAPVYQRSGSEPPAERPKRTMDADAITDSQIAAIQRLIKAQGLVEADVLRHYGLSDWRDLDSRKASTIIGQLERRAAKGTPQAPATNGPVGTVRITDAQRDEIQGLIEKAGLDVVAWVTERGLKSLAELNPEQFYREAAALRKSIVEQPVAAAR